MLSIRFVFFLLLFLLLLLFPCVFLATSQRSFSTCCIPVQCCFSQFRFIIHTFGGCDFVLCFHLRLFCQHLSHCVTRHTFCVILFRKALELFNHYLHNSCYYRHIVSFRLWAHHLRFVLANFIWLENVIVCYAFHSSLVTVYWSHKHFKGSLEFNMYCT